jgi:hypothetical protein
MSLPPTNALVAAAWIAQRVAGFTPAMVSTRLPRDVTTWQATGFVQVTPITGTPDVDLDVRHPLVQVDTWAAGSTTSPPIGKANVLAERIRIATFDGALYGKPVETPHDYDDAIVLSAYALTEPAEVPDDPSGYARFTFDLALDWARITPPEN